MFNMPIPYFTLKTFLQRWIFIKSLLID